MRLVGQIAPLVDIIFVILHDITYFLLIFIIGLVAFSHAFYVIGKNQLMQADALDPSKSRYEEDEL